MLHVALFYDNDYKIRGIDREQKPIIVTYCHIGVRSPHTTGQTHLDFSRLVITKKTMETFNDWIPAILIILGTILIIGYRNWKYDKEDGGKRVRLMLLIIGVLLLIVLLFYYIQTVIY